MKFIQIQDGISINIDKIEGIKSISDNQCEIYVGVKRYVANFPYETLLNILKNEDIVESKHSADEQMRITMAKLDKALDYQQHFAG